MTDRRGRRKRPHPAANARLLAGGLSAIATLGMVAGMRANALAASSSPTTPTDEPVVTDPTAAPTTTPSEPVIVVVTVPSTTGATAGSPAVTARPAPVQATPAPAKPAASRPKASAPKPKRIAAPAPKTTATTRGS